MKQARRHYGIAVAMPFRQGKDLEETAYIDDFRDTKYCKDRIKWMISKVCNQRASLVILSFNSLMERVCRARRCSKTRSEPQHVIPITRLVNL